MSDAHRTKIANSRILGNLIKFAEGDETIVTKAQADIGLGLLKKVMPDLSAVTLANEDGDTFKTEEVGQGAAKVLAALDAIAERS